MADKQLPSDMLADLGILLVNAERLPSIISFQNYAGVGINGLGRRIAASLNLRPGLVRDILFALWKLKQFSEVRGLTPSELVEWITANIETRAPADWKEKYLALWKSNASILEKVLGQIGDDHPLMITTKAQTLVYTHQNIFLSARLIADIRPVFDSKAEVVHDLVITHMLSLEYTDGGQNKTVLTLAVDTRDIAELQHQCARAATKILTLKKQLKDFNCIVMPDDDDEDESEGSE